jgi:hypothetical protein
MANVLTNLFNVATGSGAHEAAMREYLNPLAGGQSYNIAQGPVANYMSGYLKDYVDPTNRAGGTWKDGIMSVTGLGKSPNPFTKEGLATAANLSSDPSFQAENLFGEGTLRQTPSGYEYTGGKFDFNFEPNTALGWFEKNILRPSEYKMSFDKDFRPFNPQTRFKQQQLMNKKKQNFQNIIKAAEAKAAAEAAAKAKADAAAKYTAPRHHQDVSRNRGDHTAPTFRSEKKEGIDTKGSAMHGGKHYADGGLINFYRYGGFIG